jgi:hypothetical protein
VLRAVYELHATSDLTDEGWDGLVRQPPAAAIRPRERSGLVLSFSEAPREPNVQNRAIWSFSLLFDGRQLAIAYSAGSGYGL